MEKKGSKGVTIFGWLIIIFGILLLDLSDLGNYGKYQVKSVGITIQFLGIFLSLAWIIMGINILKLKRGTIKYLILIIVVSAIYTIIEPFTVSENYWMSLCRPDSQKIEKAMAKVQPDFRENARDILAYQYGNYMKEDVKKWVKEGVTLTYIIHGVWYIVLVCFFTRPKVKEQFRKEE